jgi:hypothetical protein
LHDLPLLLVDVVHLFLGVLPAGLCELGRGLPEGCAGLQCGAGYLHRDAHDCVFTGRVGGRAGLDELVARLVGLL